MKLLYLEHPIPNFLADVLYKGLCEEIGVENIEDQPWKALYHGLPFDGEGKVHTPFSWMPSPGDSYRMRRPMSEDAIFEQIGSFDLVVLASPREANTAWLQRLIDRVGRGALRRFVIVDGEDYTTVRWDFVERFRPDVYFKLSMVPQPFEVYPDLKARLASSTKVLPFPLASPTAPLLPVTKNIDVAFIGGNYWRPARLRAEGVPWAGRPEAEYKAALDARLRKEFSSYVGSVKEVPIAHDEFMNLLNRARVAVCVGGYGIEPLRTYEILSCPETLLCRERIPVIAPHPIVDGEHCVMFDTGDGFDHEDVVEKIGWALEHNDERKRMAAAGNALLKEHYTPRARAKQLLQEAF